MCGIVGFVDKKDRYSRAKKLRFIRHMRRFVGHRGPDSHGVYVDDTLALGHSRLSILDLSHLGSQPFTSSDSAQIIAYNGEIYNFREVREKLEQRTVFTSDTDTEVLLEGYRQWGLRVLDRLRGMWAFGLYDKKDAALHLSVDRFGIKPLYYIETKEWFAFASEAKALFVLPGIKPEVNKKVIAEYLLFRGVAGPETLYKNIKRLSPASVLRYSLKTRKTKINTYWKLKKKRLTDSSTKKNLLKYFDASIKEHLVSDVPVGLQLSGGVDSSLIAVRAKKIAGQNLHSYSIGSRDRNEFVYSDKVAKYIKTKHHKITLSKKEFWSLLPLATYYMDEPVHIPDTLAFYVLAKHARRNVKVILSGEGADEVFGGYGRYEQLLNKKKWTNRDIVLLSAYTTPGVLKKITKSLSFEEIIRKRVSYIQSLSGFSAVDRVTYSEMRTYMLPLLLRQDKMCMAHGLENRVPFLDHRLVEFGYSLPKDKKLSYTKNIYFRTKPFLKKMALDHLPDDVVIRKKVGFSVPFSGWFRDISGLGMFLGLLVDKDAQIKPWIRKSSVVSLIKDHLGGRQDNGEILWILVTLELWLRMAIKGDSPKNILKNVRNNKALKFF